MRTLFAARLGLVLLLCALHAPAKATASSTFINGSFEDGLNGWELSWEGLEVYPDDYYGWPPPPAYPYPGFTVPSNEMFSYRTPASSAAPDGQRILWVGASDYHGGAIWQMPDERSYSFDAAEALSFSQTFHAYAGTSVIGWAAYSTWCPNHTPGELVHGDTSILVDGVEVWQISPLKIESPASPGDSRESGWSQWVYPLTADGEHRVEIRIAQGCQYTSNASFDGITIVPEPTTLTLLGLGSLALVMVLRRR